MNSPPRRTPLAILLIRLFLGIIYFTAGMSKVVRHFPAIIGPVWLEERLAPYGLGLFARFIAVSELAVGTLLLTRRFAALGAVALVPMQLCIFMVTVSLHWRGTPYVLLFLLALDAVLLAHHYPRWRALLADDSAPGTTGEALRRARLLGGLRVAAIALLLASAAVVPERPEARIPIALACLLLLGIGFAAWRSSRRAE